MKTLTISTTGRQTAALISSGLAYQLNKLVATATTWGPCPVPASASSLGLDGYSGTLWDLLARVQVSSESTKTARAAADAATETLLRMVSRQSPYLFNLSLGSGLAGIARVLDEASTVLGTSRYLRAAESLLLGAHHDYLLNSPNPNGFAQGKLGLIYALLRIYKQTFSPALALLLDRYVLALIAEINLSSTGGLVFKGLRLETDECTRILNDLYLFTGNYTYVYLQQYLVPDDEANPAEKLREMGAYAQPVTKFWPPQTFRLRQLGRKLLAPIHRFILRQQLFSRLSLSDLFHVLLTKSFHRTLFVLEIVNPQLLVKVQVAICQLTKTGADPSRIVQCFLDHAEAEVMRADAVIAPVLAEVLRLEQIKHSLLLALNISPDTTPTGRQHLRQQAFKMLNLEQPDFEKISLRWRFPLTLLQLSRNYFFNPTLPDAASEFHKALQVPGGPFTYLIYPDQANGQVAEHVLQEGDDELLRLFTTPCRVAEALAKTKSICKDPEFMIRYAVQKGILVAA